tara:strand:- start:9849 stop:10499 length:651 start_codon:yes stop_codon:yes gene_type:complete
MKIACVGYRDWSLSIYKRLEESLSDFEFLIQNSVENFSENEIRKFVPNYVLFYGWSSMISENFINDHKCLMLHPSPLPKYRGGSPIQNQIIRGEINSAVTIFIMDKGIDTGPICRQAFLSLDGNLKDILKSIEDIGFSLTLDIFKNGTNEYEQDQSRATQFKRLKPEMSEITLSELANKDSKYLNNKIRMLQDPYPNPYIRSRDGKKLYIKTLFKN